MTRREGEGEGEGGSPTQKQDMPGPRAKGPGGGPWTLTVETFVQHQLNNVNNFRRQGRSAVFRLESKQSSA